MTDFCGTLVRRHDRDRFILSLCVPAAVRPALWALYAFNYEIARTRETVTDAPLGRIRLQWWREAVDESLRPDAPQFHHEILRALAPYVHAMDLSRVDLHALINAREADMVPGGVAGLTALEEYAVATNLPLLRLGLKICGQAADEAALEAVAGAYGLTGLIRAHHAHTAQGAQVTDAAAVLDRARGLAEGAGKPGGLAGAHGRMARLYQAQLARGRADPPPFLLFRLLFSRQ